MDDERKQRFLLMIEVTLAEAGRANGKLENYLNSELLKDYSTSDYENYSVESMELIESAVADYRDLLANSVSEQQAGLNLILVRIAVKGRLQLLKTVIAKCDPKKWMLSNSRMTPFLIGIPIL